MGTLRWATIKTHAEIVALTLEMQGRFSSVEVVFSALLAPYELQCVLLLA